MQQAVFFAAIAFGLLGQAPATNEPGPTQTPPAVEGATGGQPARAEGERRVARRDRMQEYVNATPEQRRDMRLQRLVGMLARTYDLDDSQKQAVAAEAKKMQVEYYEKLGPAAAEMDQLEGDMAKYWAERRPGGRGRGQRPRGGPPGAGAMGPGGMGMGGPGRDPEFAKPRDRLRELRQAHPFDIEAAFKRIETILPADKVAIGQQRRAEWQQQMQNWREGRDARRGADGGQGPRRRERPPTAAGPEAGGGDAPLGGPTEATVARSAAPEHAWEAFARKFAAQHELTAPQLAASRSIVKEMIGRETAYRASKKADFAEAEKIASPGERAARVKQLEQPVEEMFGELKTRLDELLTAEQRGTP